MGRACRRGPFFVMPSQRRNLIWSAIPSAGRRPGPWRGGVDLSRALDRLGRCEDLLSDLEREQTELAQRLEELRLQGKNKTVQFKELMARKLVNQQLRLRLEQYKLP